jgi:hypothetical protein
VEAGDFPASGGTRAWRLVIRTRRVCALQFHKLLLKRHQAFYANAELHSMKDAVATVIAEVEQAIQAWIDGA